MRATTIMLLAFGALIIAHWSNNESTVTTKLVVEMTVAILIVAALDQGNTEPIAKGFAWIFLAAVLLSKNSPITGLTKAAGTGSGPPAVQAV